MVELAGGIGLESLDAMLDATYEEPWYETEQLGGQRSGVALTHHGGKDSGGHATWTDGTRVGVVHGVVSNRGALELTLDDVFTRLADDPLSLLPDLSGPFALALVDPLEDTVLVATDVLSTRPVYYTQLSDGVAFSSSLLATLTQRDSLTVDRQAVADMLSFGLVFGEKTYATEANALPPASVLEYADGDASVTRYYTPDYGREPASGYVTRTLDHLRNAVTDAVRTAPQNTGLWLSGGLDSRTLAALLRDEHGRVQSLTYDGNPPDGSNLQPARQTADVLDLDHREVPVDPGDFAQDVQRGIAVTDGLKTWSSYLSPGFLFDGLADAVDVVFEGAPQGELFGEQPWRYHLTDLSPMDALARLGGRTGDDTIASLLDGTDPRRSLATEVERAAGDSAAAKTLDVWYRNVPVGAHFRGNELFRSQVGTRTPFADRELVDHLAGMPPEYRIATFPGTNGKIPRSMSPLKRDIVRELGDGLATIPYERTRIAPKRALALNDATFVGKHLAWRAFGGPDYPLTTWTRERSDVRETVVRWLDSAADRECFDAATVERLRDEHLRGDENHVRTLSTITTVSEWLSRAERQTDVTSTVAPLQTQ